MSKTLVRITLACCGLLFLAADPAAGQKEKQTAKAKPASAADLRPTPHTESAAMDKFKALEFREIGPAVMGGRIDDFAVVEGNPNIVYVGAASGGVWKTTNNGTTC